MILASAFQTRSLEVLAAQLTVENAPQMARCLGGILWGRDRPQALVIHFRSDRKPAREASECDIWVKVGWWVVLNGDRFRTLRDEHFREIYEPKEQALPPGGQEFLENYPV